jgi:hypothetical protein
MALGGGGPLEDVDGRAGINRFTAQADAAQAAARAARLGGYKSPFRRLLERLRPRRQEQDGGSQTDYGTTAKSGR